MLRLILSLLIVAGLAVGGLFAWGYGQFTQPGPAEGEITLVLPRGGGLVDIARRLEMAGVVSDARLFAVGVRLYDRQGDLKAGEYRMDAGISMRGVMDVLVGGITVVRKLTIPEGLLTAEIVDLVAKADGLDGEITMLPGEGRLLPETYHYSYGDDRAALIARMTAAMDAALAELWSTRDPDLPLQSPEEALTLASIVEKETAVPGERAHIAGVFVNRLKRGMRLQSDPTVAYGLTNGAQPLDRPLSRKDLTSKTAYNTYVIKRLPPGPIANPGRAAIAAVMRPLTTKDLYFVADGTGGHAFAQTFAEHQKNVRRWRKIQRERNAN